jgi:hypothetical protein
MGYLIFSLFGIWAIIVIAFKVYLVRSEKKRMLEIYNAFKKLEAYKKLSEEARQEK